ncbi:DUF4333 domain-containing protein [Amycolatopsis thermophila]|uniref:DUF4333 domain-containing protein n=1 Tax=Amycolatopsis thermophila TaxID=206084 RepID=A0ABU0F2X2_9PSEU|nr:DUF4333 domain-containing protein [Amycolatopsis thermophila]MDQ0381743.1 hypothetical protein [Amycolatopsis thermophila]
MRTAVVVTGAALLLSACDSAPPPAPSAPPVPPATSTPASTKSLTPVRRVFDPVRVQDGVRRVLTESYLLTGVGDVSCPAGEDVVTGRVFECTVDIAGEKKKVTITVRDADGGYEVSQPEP